MQLSPLTNGQRCARFGQFKFLPSPQPGNKEHITILNGWAADNIVTVSCPQLRLMGIGHVNLHYKAKASFLELWADWEREGLLDHVKTWNGSWVPRFKRGMAGGGQQALSNHSWGTAFDINAKLYPLGYSVPQDSPMRQLAASANKRGWFWGGDFRSRKDPMHFEYVGEAK